MRNVRALVLLLACLCATCTWIEDNGTHLAFALERGAKRLAASDSTEEIVRYEPLTGTNQTYDVVIYPSASLEPPYRYGGLTVTGKRGGSTTYHRRYVYVPNMLRITKTNEPVEIVLRKTGNRIDVVELR